MEVSKTGRLPERASGLGVWKLAWPILVSMLSYTVMSLVDTLFVGRLGTAPLAAIGVGASASYLVIGFGFGLLGGLRVNVAQRTGAGEDEAAERLLWQGLGIAALFGAAAACTAAVGPWLMQALAGPGEVSSHAEIYFRIRVLAAPLTYAMIATKSWFEGRGDTKTPMKANVFANVLNIALDPLLIFGWGPVPALGIGGAALATVVSIAAAAIWLQLKAGPVLRRTSPRQERALWRPVLRVGVPIGVRQVLEVGAWVAFVALVARAGELELAAHVIVIRLLMVSFLPGHAISEAVSVLVGQFLGAGRPLEARRAYRFGLAQAVVFMACMGGLFVAVPEPLIGIFGAEEGVVAVASRLLWIAAFFQVADAVAMSAHGALSGAGDTRFTMMAGVATSWGVKLPLGWLLVVPMGGGAAGAWLALLAEIVLIAVIYATRVRGERWLAHTVVGSVPVPAESPPRPEPDEEEAAA